MEPSFVSTMTRTLRVALLGVRVQEARRYHVSIQALAPGQAPIGVVVLNDLTSDQYRPDQVARTETSELTQHPEFLNRVFILRLAEPLAASLAPQINLHCNLFALPSADSTSPGAMVAGKEVDELMGSATVQVRGESTQRLLRGERVTLPVVLNDSRGGDRDKATQEIMASLYGGKAGKELLLELQLLDAQVTLPRDTYDQQITGGTLHGSTGGAPSQNNSKECKLMVLVTKAENLPTVRSADGKSEEEPSTFVALKTLKDVRNSVPAQASTHVCPSSTKPVWGQLLQVQCLESDLSTEELHLAIVNDQDSRLMLKATLPLSHLVPRVHYNLKLLIPGGPMGSSVALYVTLCLTDCQQRELRHVRALGPSASHLLSARLASCTRPVQSLVPSSVEQPAVGSQIMAVWSLAAESPGAAPLPIESVYTTLDISNLAAVAKRLESMSEALSSAAQGAGSAAVHSMPVHIVPPLTGTTQGDQMIWPPEHLAQVPLSMGPDTALHLQLHLVTSGATHTTPVAAVTVPHDKLEGLRTQPALTDGLPMQGDNTQGASCILELGSWRSAAYQEHLQKLRLGQEDDPTAGRGSGSAANMTWQRQTQGGGVGAAGGVAASVLETLVDDLLVKQVALERVARQMDGAECRSEMMGWRLSDAQHQIRHLQDDAQKLRQLLHEEKEAIKSPLLENSHLLSKEDIVERCEGAMAAYARERRRNTELVHRLQQLHGEQVDVLEMKKRYQQLQAAHMDVMKMMNSIEGPLSGKISTYRQTIKTQEQVISKLESLLEQTLSKARSTQPVAAALSTENQKLKEQLRSTSAHASRKEHGFLEDLTSTREEVGQLRTANSELATQNVQLNLQLKQAEERTGAARDELVSAIKRYAAEIADLKWRLAEKDAQMMGGFGSPSRLDDRDDDLGIPRVNPALFAHIASATAAGNSPPLGRSPKKLTPRTSSAEAGATGPAAGVSPGRSPLRSLSAGSQQQSKLAGAAGGVTEGAGDAGEHASKQAWPQAPSPAGSQGPSSPAIKAVRSSPHPPHSPGAATATANPTTGVLSPSGGSGIGSNRPSQQLNNRASLDKRSSVQQQQEHQPTQPKRSSNVSQQSQQSGAAGPATTAQTAAAGKSK